MVNLPKSMPEPMPTVTSAREEPDGWVNSDLLQPAQFQVAIDTGDVELTPAITHHYEEIPAPDVERHLTSRNRNTLNKATVIDDIGRSGGSAWRRCSPP